MRLGLDLEVGISVKIEIKVSILVRNVTKRDSVEVDKNTRVFIRVITKTSHDKLKANQIDLIVSRKGITKMCWKLKQYGMPILIELNVFFKYPSSN